MMWHYPIYNSGTWWWLGMMLFWLVGIGLVSYLIFLSMKGRDYRDDDTVEIIKRRYARGEIDKETFERMKSELKS